MAVVTQQDGTTLQTWDTTTQTYTRTVSGVVLEQRPFTTAESATAAAAVSDALHAANTATLRQAARTALTTDRAYLDAVAAGTVTQAQAVAQVAALTRQVMALGRLLVGADLLDTVDTP